MLIAKTPAIGSFLSKNPKATTTNERQLVTLKASPPLLYTFFQLLLYSLERRDFPERSHVPCLQLLSCWILSCYFTDGFILQIQSSLGSDDCEKTLWKENQQHNGPICQLPIHPHHCFSQCCWYCCLVMIRLSNRHDTTQHKMTQHRIRWHNTKRHNTRQHKFF